MRYEQITTSTGKVVSIDMIGRNGYGPSSQIVWKIVTYLELSKTEIEEIVERVFPSGGYGSSSICETKHSFVDESIIYETEVRSNASCD